MILPEGAVESGVRLLRIDVLDEKGDELGALCPGHLARTGKADHSPSWSINTQTGVHYCFSCHYKGNLYTLIRDIAGPASAKEFLGGSLSKGVPVPEGYAYDRGLKIPTVSQRENLLVAVSESSMVLFQEPPTWALDERRITAWAASAYGVRWDDSRAAWILPLRSSEGVLIGYQVKGQRRKFVLSHPVGVSKRSVLFGFHEMSGAESVVLVESSLDAVRLYGLGFPAVALCGSHASQEQLELLQHFPFVLVAMDNDTAGKAEADRLRRLRTGFQFSVAEYPEGRKDVGDMDDAEIFRMVDDSGF